MATRFQEQAERQLSSGFQEQRQAIQEQIPALEEMFQNLVSGLEQQKQTGVQEIAESAAQRGVARSTIPVDAEQDLQQEFLSQRGQLQSQQAQQIGNIRQQLGQLRTQETQATTNLASNLQEADIREREFELEKEQMQEELRIAKEKLRFTKAQEGGGTGSGSSEGRELSDEFIRQTVNRANDFSEGMELIMNSGGGTEDLERAADILGQDTGEDGDFTISSSQSSEIFPGVNEQGQLTSEARQAGRRAQGSGGRGGGGGGGGRGASSGSFLGSFGGGPIVNISSNIRGMFGL